MDHELWNLKQVCDFMGGANASTIYRWGKEGLFPASHKIGPATARWKRSEVEAARDRMMRDEAEKNLMDVAGRIDQLGKEIAALEKVAQKQGDIAGVAKLQALRATLGIGMGQ